ncbi:MAG: class E sortase [Actinomycetota bacterium]|nr:class E sortase [Actinomycetota bacterium]
MSARKVASVATGVLGELLITAGLVLGLFVVWQLWWTDVVGERAQAQILHDLGWATPLPAPSEVPDDGIADPQPGDPPVPARPGTSETFASIVIPRFGEGWQSPVSEGVTRAGTLDELGVGWYPHSQLPGELGNFALAGHRVTWGKPFNQIADLEEDDLLVVRTPEVWYVYRVTEHLVVLPHQVEVVAPVPGEIGADPDGHYITLTSCHPMFSLRERYVVHGEMEYWAWTADGIPAELAGGA